MRSDAQAVLPSELERCAVSDKRVLKTMLVTSSVSEARLQHRLAHRRAGFPSGAPLGMARTPHPAQTRKLGARRVDPPKRQVDHGRCCEIGHAEFS